MSLSVIIPLAPGESEWRGLLDQLARALPDGAEVILVPAGESIVPPENWPAQLDLRVTTSDPGRATQMNRGADLAVGTWLWFLHADTRLSGDCVPRLQRFLSGGQMALGWFDLAFRPDGPWLTCLNALGANLRSRWFGLPFGDQGFVLPARLFAELGGFDTEAAAGEDHLLVWQARHAGIPLQRIGAVLHTSARKYRQHGWLATTCRHLRLTVQQVRDGQRHKARDAA